MSTYYSEVLDKFDSRLKFETRLFDNLIDELAGSENRISTARTDYNSIAKEYNTYIKKFPNSIIAGMFGFSSKDYYKADEGSNETPKVNFN